MESKTSYNIEDSELVLFVREDNEDAKEEIFKKYIPLLCKEINRFKKRAFALGIEEADLSQEAMLAFSYAINNYSEEENAKFITFATLCIRRKLSNYIEKSATKKKVIETEVALDAEYDDNDALIDQMANANVIDPLRQIMTNESLDETFKTIAGELSKNERCALKYDVEGKSVNEIANLMGKTPKQVYNLIHRARSKVKS